MASTHTSLHYHLVFSTKHREPWLGPESRSRVHEYLGGTIRGMEGVAHAVGGTGDHVHVLAGLKATHCLADVMRELKSESSAWIRRELGWPGFAWQEGYGAFTLGASGIEGARAYVLNQETHHRTKSFQEEYLEFLRRGMVEFEEKWLW
jgi:REP element-mobilizing transposase RayT